MTNVIIFTIGFVIGFIIFFLYFLYTDIVVYKNMTIGDLFSNIIRSLLFPIFIIGYISDKILTCILTVFKITIYKKK